MKHIVEKVYAIGAESINRLSAELDQANEKLAYLLDEMQNSAKLAQDQEDKIAELKKQNEDLTEALYFYCHHAANYTDHDEQYVFFDQDQGRVACAALKKYKEG